MVSPLKVVQAFVEAQAVGPEVQRSLDLLKQLEQAVRHEGREAGAVKDLFRRVFQDSLLKEVLEDKEINDKIVYQSKLHPELKDSNLSSTLQNVLMSNVLTEAEKKVIFDTIKEKTVEVGSLARQYQEHKRKKNPPPSDWAN
jgi:hypothetical protein